VGRMNDPYCPGNEGTVDPNPSRMGACLLICGSASGAGKFSQRYDRTGLVMLVACAGCAGRI
jgi:hypothetical protein